MTTKICNENKIFFAGFEITSFICTLLGWYCYSKKLFISLIEHHWYLVIFGSKSMWPVYRGSWPSLILQEKGLKLALFWCDGVDMKLSEPIVSCIMTSVQAIKSSIKNHIKVGKIFIKFHAGIVKIETCLTNSYMQEPKVHIWVFTNKYLWCGKQLTVVGGHHIC